LAAASRVKLTLFTAIIAVPLNLAFGVAAAYGIPKMICRSRTNRRIRENSIAGIRRTLGIFTNSATAWAAVLLDAV
jgi:hypothetical protein